MTQSLIPEPSAVLSALGAPDAAVIAPVTGGADTLIWRVRWRECDAALRIFRPQQANVCRKEVAVMRAVSAAPTRRHKPACFLPSGRATACRRS